MRPALKGHFVPSGSPVIPSIGIPATLEAHIIACIPPIEIKAKTKL
jgi:hypothetical protein